LLEAPPPIVACLPIRQARQNPAAARSEWQSFISGDQLGEWLPVESQGTCLVSLAIRFFTAQRKFQGK